MVQDFRKGHKARSGKVQKAIERQQRRAQKRHLADFTLIPYKPKVKKKKSKKKKFVNKGYG